MEEEEGYDIDADYAWRINIPLVEGHFCSMECEIKVVDEENNIYGCLTGGTLHYCSGNECERAIITDEGQVCLWSGKMLQSNYDNSTGFQFIRPVTDHVISISDSSYMGVSADRAFKKNTPAKKKQREETEVKYVDPLKGVKPLKIRKIPKPPTPIKRTDEEQKQLNQQKTLLKRRTDIVTALEYLVWNDEVRNNINKQKKDQFSTEMCKYSLKYVKLNKCLPPKEIIDEQYLQIKKNHQFLPLIGLSNDELTAVKNRITETILKEYEKLALDKGRSSLRVLHFALGYLMLMIEGINYKNFEIPRDEFMNKYHIDPRFLTTTDVQFSVGGEHKKKPQIPNIKKDTIGNASKDIKQLLMDLYH